MKQSVQMTRLHAMDGMRGFFTAFVVLIHMKVDVPLIQNSFVFIGLFLTYSGLLITANTLNVIAKKGTFDKIEFWKRRVARIIPMAYTVLLAICVYILLSVTFFPTLLTGIDVYWLRQDLLWAVFYGSNHQSIVSGDDYFARYAKIPILRHYWSLAIEEQYYIMWPLLLNVWLFAITPVVRFCAEKTEKLRGATANQKPRSREKDDFTYALYALLVGEALVFSVSSSYQYYLLSSHTPYYVLHYSTFVHLKEFALGGTMAVLLRLVPSTEHLLASSTPYTPQLSFASRLLVEVTMLALFIFLLVVPSTFSSNSEALMEWYFAGYGGLIMAGALSIIAVLLALQTQELNGREQESRYFPVSQYFFGSQLLSTMGVLSYSAYVWHLPILIWLGVPETENKSFLYLVFVFVAIYAFSYLASFTFEFPVQKLILKCDGKKILKALPLVMLLMMVIVMTVTRSYEDPKVYLDLEAANSVELHTERELLPTRTVATGVTTCNWTNAEKGDSNNKTNYFSYLSSTFSSNMMEFEMRQLLKSSLDWDYKQVLEPKNLTTKYESVVTSNTNGYTGHLGNSNIDNPHRQHLVIQGMTPTYTAPGSHALGQIATLSDLLFLRTSTCDEVVSFVNKVSSNKQRADDVFVLYLTDSVYSTILTNEYLNKGKKLHLKIQENDSDAITHSVIVQQVPSSDTTEQCNGWPRNGITRIDKDTPPGVGRVFVVTVDIRDAMAHYDKRYPQGSSSRGSLSGQEEGQDVVLSGHNAQMHSLMWIGEIEESSAIGYYRYINAVVVQHAVRIAPGLAPFFNYCHAQSIAGRGVEGEAYEEGDTKSNADSVSVSHPPGSAVKNEGRKKYEKHILFFGDSIGLRMSALLEKSRISLTNTRHQCVRPTHNGTHAQKGNNIDNHHIRMNLLKFLDGIKFKSLQKCFYFLGAPSSSCSDFCDQYISRSTINSLSASYKDYIRANRVSTVVLSYTAALYEITHDSPESEASFDFFMYQCLVLRGLNVKHIYIQDTTTTGGQVLVRPNEADAYDFSDPHGLHRYYLSALNKHFDRCEKYLMAWDGVIRTNESGSCMTSFHSFLEMAAKGKEGNSTMVTGDMAPGNKFRTKRLNEGAELESRSPNSARTILLQALQEIKKMVVSMELAHLTCPHVAEDSKDCINSGHGFNPLLPDKLHPSGAAGKFISRRVLTELAQDLYARSSAMYNTNIGKAHEERSFLVSMNFSRVYPNEQFSMYEVLKIGDNDDDDADDKKHENNNNNSSNNNNNNNNSTNKSLKSGKILSLECETPGQAPAQRGRRLLQLRHDARHSEGSGYFSKW